MEYLKDFTHAEEWDPGTQTCTRNDAGPIAVGTSWHNVSKIFGVTTELTYTADLEMKGAAKLATPAMKLIFEKLAGDTEKQMTEVLNKLA
jgi:hypothetical protein